MYDETYCYCCDRPNIQDKCEDEEDFANSIEPIKSMWSSCEH